MFDEIIEKYRANDLVLQVINLTFSDGLSADSICDELSIGRTTFFDYRQAILTQAAVTATIKQLSMP